MRDTRFEVVASFLTRIDAELARTALESEGIEATVMADDVGGTRPHLWLSGVRVLVAEEDADRARAVLEATDSAR